MLHRVEAHDFTLKVLVETNWSSILMLSQAPLRHAIVFTLKGDINRITRDLLGSDSG
jgi:hypothetical protein